METIDKFEQALREGCERFIKSGGLIRTGIFVTRLTDNKECRCPIGTLAYRKASSLTEIVKCFGVDTLTEMWAFIYGFDSPGEYSNPEHPALKSPKYYQLGEKFRKHYIEGDKQW